MCPSPGRLLHRAGSATGAGSRLVARRVAVAHGAIGTRLVRFRFRTRRYRGRDRNANVPPRIRPLARCAASRDHTLRRRQGKGGAPGFARCSEEVPIARSSRKGERWDSNPRPPGPQPGALPAELRPPRTLESSSAIPRRPAVSCPAAADQQAADGYGVSGAGAHQTCWTVCRCLLPVRHRRGGSRWRAGEQY